MHDVLQKLAFHMWYVFWAVFTVWTVLLLAWTVRTQRTWRSRRRIWPRDWGIVTTLAVVVPLAILVLTGASFAYQDDDLLLEYSVVGRGVPNGILPLLGRYTPLYLQEFAVISHWSTSPIAYYSFVCVELLVLGLLLNVLLAELSLPWRFIGTALVLWSSGIAILFVEAIYPERNSVLLVALLLVALRRFDEQPTRLNMATALLAANTALYFKEPTFLLVAGIASTRIAFAVLAREHTTRSTFGSVWQRAIRRPLDLALLASCVVFVVQLGVVVAGGSGFNYVQDQTIGPISAASRYLQMQPLFLVFIAACAHRIFRLRRGAHFDGVWDPAAVGALLYLLGLIISGLAADRYTGPVVMVAGLFTVREAATLRLNARHRPWVVGGMAVLSLWVVVGGGFRIAEHASVASGTEEVADFVASYAAQEQAPVRLYFPSTKSWRIMNFVENLQYRHPEALQNIRLVAPFSTPDGLCVYFRSFRCETAPTPTEGDLIVRLPDDTERPTIQGESTIFDYTWLPVEVPDPLGRLYYVEAPLYSGSSMPDGWLHATVARQD